MSLISTWLKWLFHVLILGKLWRCPYKNKCSTFSLQIKFQPRFNGQEIAKFVIRKMTFQLRNCVFCLFLRGSSLNQEKWLPPSGSSRCVMFYNIFSIQQFFHYKNVRKAKNKEKLWPPHSSALEIFRVFVCVHNNCLCLI